MEKIFFALQELLTKDIEIQQYQLLSILKKYRIALKELKVYPALTHLHEAKITLENLIRDNFQYEVNEISKSEENSNMELFASSFEKPQNSSVEINSRREFMYWILAEIENLIEEAEAIEQYVRNSINIVEKGDIYDFKNEGIFVIRNSDEKAFHIYFYNFKLSKIILDENTPIEYKLLTTISYNEVNEKTEQDIIFKIASKYFNFSKVTVWVINYEFDLPFEETVLPAALESLKKEII